MQRRWNTRFGRFVRGFKPRSLCTRLRPEVSPQTVYDWVAARQAPRIEFAEQIVELSDGQLSLDDVYRQRRRAQR
jgi:hypothetical protein